MRWRRLPAKGMEAGPSHSRVELPLSFAAREEGRGVAEKQRANHLQREECCGAGPEVELAGFSRFFTGNDIFGG